MNVALRPQRPLEDVVAPPADAMPMIFGVARWISARFGVSVVVVRAAFVVLAAAGGFGLIPYVLAAIAIRDRTPPAATAIAPSRDLGIALVTAGIIGELRYWWPGVRLESLIPAALVAIGISLGWRPASSMKVPGRHTSATLARLAAGATLLIGGLVAYASQSVPLSSLRDAGLAVAMALAGIGLVAGPTVVGFVQGVTNEREQRIRDLERAEVAAHLHDSVMQTLTLIQKRSNDPTAVVSLARGQERYLRRWLYGGRLTGDTTATSTWKTALEAAVDDFEDLHGITVETVAVGDTTLTEAVSAALAATREALVNAAKFSRQQRVSLYSEVIDRRLSVFVRDRGVGFDPLAVPDDRRGISESIVGRMQRAGGNATVRSASGEGTEVEITLPVGRRGAVT